MTPDYLEALANFADPDQLWRLAWDAQRALSTHQRMQLDAGVALRRYASHERRLLELLKEQRSLLITPLAPNSAALLTVDTPPEHTRLRRRPYPGF